MFRDRKSGGETASKKLKQLFWEIQEELCAQKKDYFLAHRKRWPSNTRAFIRVLLCFSKTVDEIPHKEIVLRAEEFILALALHLDAPFHYFAFHPDEQTLHVHALLGNYSYENHRTVIRGLRREDFSIIQDRAGEYFSDLGFERGIPKKMTGESHRGLAPHHEEAEVLKRAGRVLFRETQRDLLRRGVLSGISNELTKGGNRHHAQA